MESRRSVLRGGAVLALAAALPSGTAEATQNGLLATFFRDKSNADLDRTMSHFSRSNATYIDATLGWTMYSWQAVYDAFAQYMPTWPAGTKSYETRVVGDRNSMVVFFTDSAGMFGPNEIRLAGAVDVRGGKIVRWVDYWDGRHFGLGDYRKLRVPDAQYPTDFAESKTGEAAAPAAWHAVASLTNALRARNHQAAVECFASDAVFEDLPSHIQVVGPKAIGHFLAAAGTQLPYAAPETRVRHVLTGGYEWVGPTTTGITALELDGHGKITRLTSMWDGARVSRDDLVSLAAAAVEE
jgi:hypothetical protein